MTGQTPRRSVPVLWVTATDADHLLSDEALADAMTGDDYVALCEASIWPKPMTCSPMPRCARCAALTRPVPPLRRPGLFSRLLRQLTKSPAGADPPWFAM